MDPTLADAIQETAQWIEEEAFNHGVMSERDGLEDVIYHWSECAFARIVLDRLLEGAP